MIQSCNFIITGCPKTPPKVVSEAAIKKPRTNAILRSNEVALSKTVPVASVASETRTVSQPTKTKYESSPGNKFPLTPNAARERVMVGALERLPASELTPTNANEPKVPITAAIVACQKEIPKPRKNAPYERASRETFAPAHGQKRSLAFPRRSDSPMKLISFSSGFIGQF